MIYVPKQMAASMVRAHSDCSPASNFSPAPFLFVTPFFFPASAYLDKRAATVPTTPFFIMIDLFDDTCEEQRELYW